MSLHSVLERQLRRLGLSARELPRDAAKWAELLAKVSRSYTDGDHARYMLERSLTLSSAEMRRLNESLLQASETKIVAERNKLQAVISSLPTGLCLLDRAGDIVSANPEAERLLGWSQEELIGRSFSTLLSAEAPAARRTAAEIASPGEEPDEDALMTRKDGEPLPVSYAVTRVEDPGGTIAAVAVFLDITARKQAEAAMEAAREAAEAAARAKSEFLANMSHEIRTPLNAVVGITALLLDTELNEEQRDFVETVHTSGDALLAIINDILDFSKIESGQLELDKQPFELRRCLEQSIDIVVAGGASRGLELAYFVDEGVPRMIEADEVRLRQILVNLLSNAVKFTREGEVYVSARSTPRREGGHEFLFSIVDTGIGIPASRRDQLFRSFSQVDSSTTRHFGGTGLGLAISKSLCELMGGRIWVESEVGSGSTFSFTIHADAAPVEAPAGPPPELAGKRVLVVDDTEVNLRLVAAQARSWRMLPETTQSPREALAWLEDGKRYDLAILDMQMPEMDGFQLGRRIRAALGSSAPRLLLLSSIGGGVGDPDGIFDVQLSKPIKSSPLLEALRRACDPERGSAPRPASRPARYANISDRLPLRILLAEDNPVNQKVAILTLQRFGLTADVAPNGLEVLAKLRSKSYDVVLMDVQMPEMDGLEATRRLCSEWPAGERPVVIAMTANALSSDRQRCIEAGMDDYLSKPLRAGELLDALERWGEVALGRRA